MKSAILIAVISGLSSGLLAGLIVKILDLRKERYLLRVSWMNEFRNKVVNLLEESEKFRLWIFRQSGQDHIINSLTNVFVKGCNVQLYVRSKTANQYISREMALDSEDFLDKLSAKMKPELEALWGEVSLGKTITTEVDEIQRQIVTHARIVLKYNWNRIERGLDILNEQNFH